MRAIQLWAVSAIMLAGIAAETAAMDNPEIIRWKATPEVFVDSVFQAALGRNPGPQDLRGIANLDLNSANGRWNLFWSLIGSEEYQVRWGHLARLYHVYWDTRQVDTQWGRRPCHCYYFAESAGGFMPSMQYTGFPYPGGPFSFPVARALVLLYAQFDQETCPHYDCGYQGAEGPQTGPGDRGNLVRDGSFAGFGRPGGPWGTGLYASNGIWWNSGGAGSTAGTVGLNADQRPPAGAATALYVNNPSARGPNVFGTTAQRINVVQGRTYEIRFWASARSLASDGGVSLAVDPQWRIRPVRLPGGSYGWTEFSGSFTATAGFVDVRIISEDRGEVWISDVRLTSAR